MRPRLRVKCACCRHGAGVGALSIVACRRPGRGARLAAHAIGSATLEAKYSSAACYAAHWPPSGGGALARCARCEDVRLPAAQGGSLCEACFKAAKAAAAAAKAAATCRAAGCRKPAAAPRTNRHPHYCSVACMMTSGDIKLCPECGTNWFAEGGQGGGLRCGKCASAAGFAARKRKAAGG